MSVYARPPIRSLASSIIKGIPSFCRVNPALIPAAPAPIIAILSDIYMFKVTILSITVTLANQGFLKLRKNLR